MNIFGVGNRVSRKKFNKIKANLDLATERLKKREQEYHFVGDYNALVKDLVQSYPLAEAMSIAVGGGDYDLTGELMAGVVRRCGLLDGMSIVDLGCGSGRLAKHLAINFSDLSYKGIDVVQDLLNYAKSQTPDSYQYILNHKLNLPVEDVSADMIVSFSVFTHLLHQESFLYMREAKRALRPGGRFVFSFLETDKNWKIFEGMVERASRGEKDHHLNIFMERPQIEGWAKYLGFDVVGYDFGTPHSGDGQTVAVLEKPL